MPVTCKLHHHFITPFPIYVLLSMKQKLPVIAGFLLVALALWNGCKKPGALGYELLDDEYGEFQFTDTISLRCTIEREDSALTSDITSIADRFLCGQVIDPVFGKSVSDLYALVQSETLNPNFDHTTEVFDSIVLYLGYDKGGFYGDTTAAQNLRVYRVDNGYAINDTKIYYSPSSMPASQEIGRVDNFLPRPSTKDTLFEGIKGPYLRVALDPAFGQELFNLDSASYSADTLFYQKLRGLKIVASSSSSPGSMLAFDLNDNNFSRIRLYYHADTTRKNFDYFFKGANKFTHFEHDHSYNGATVGPLIGQPADDKLYIQGMQGVRMKIEFPYANKLDRIAVNQAELVLTIGQETANLPAASQLVLSQIENDSTFLTSDVLYSFGNTTSATFYSFGGSPKQVVDNGTTVTRYRLTMSELFQHMVDDDSSTNTEKRTVYLNVYPRSRSGERAVFYGPKNASFPAKLELIYTKVKQ